jgi:hypothetical protein
VDNRLVVRTVEKSTGQAALPAAELEDELEDELLAVEEPDEDEPDPLAAGVAVEVLDDPFEPLSDEVVVLVESGFVESDPLLEDEPVDSLLPLPRESLR